MTLKSPPRIMPEPLYDDSLHRADVGLLLTAFGFVLFVAMICVCASAVNGDASQAASASDKTSEAPAGALLVESYEWHDADTPVHCRIRLPYGVILDEPRGIRAANYDAWEVGSRGGANVTDAERQRGRKALEQLRLLSVGKSLYCVPIAGGKRDSFGRPLGQLWLHRPGQWIELGAWATEHGHVRKP